MDIISSIERIHNLVTLIVKVHSSLSANKELSLQLVNRLEALDEILQLPANRKALADKSSSLALQHLVSICEDGVEYVKKFESKNTAGRILAFQSAQDEFLSINQRLTSAVGEVQAFLVAEQAGLEVQFSMEDIKEAFEKGALDLMKDDPSFQLLVWLDRQENHDTYNKGSMNTLQKSNRRLAILPKTYQRQITAEFLANRAIMRSNTAPCRWRVISNTFHARDKGQKEDPDCVGVLCNQLGTTLEARVPVLFFTSAARVKDTITACRTGDRAYIYAGVSASGEALKNFAMFSTLLWLGPWKPCEKEIYALQDQGIAVPRAVVPDQEIPEFIDETISDFTEASPSGVECASCQDTSKFKIVVAFSKGDKKSDVQQKVDTVKDIKTNKRWRYDVYLLCVDGDLNPAITNEIGSLGTPITLPQVLGLFAGASNPNPNPSTGSNSPSNPTSNPKSPTPFRPMSIRITSFSFTGLAPVDSGTADPYVIITSGTTKIGQTKYQNKTLNPNWTGLSLPVKLEKAADSLKIEIYDHNTFTSHIYMGGCIIQAPEFVGNSLTVPVVDVLQKGFQAKGTMTISFSKV